MAYWLIKSEPDCYSWDQFVADGGTRWDGVRNYQAAANLKAMKVGDLCFWYNSNIGKEAVAIAKVTKEAYLDPTDPAGKFVAVDVAPVEKLRRPVTLAEMKASGKLTDFALIRQSRLSVVPVSDAHWATIMAMAAN